MTIRSPLLTLLAGLVTLALANPLQAAETGTDPQAQPAVEDLQSLVETLEDDSRRQALVADLRTLIEARRALATAEDDAPSPGARLLQALSTPARDFAERLGDMLRHVATIPGWLASLPEHFGQVANRSQLEEVLLKLLAALLVGIGAEALARRALDGRGHPETPTVTLGERLVALAIRIALEVALVLVFAVTAYGMLALLNPSPDARFVAVALINASLIVRVALAVARLILAPRNPGARPLPNLGDDTAAYLYVWVRRLVGLPVYTYFALEALLLLGLPLALHDLGMQLLSLYVLLLVLTLILQNRAPVANWLQGEPDEHSMATPVRNRLAALWHVFAIVYVLGVYAVISSGGLDNTIVVVRATVLSVLIIVGLRMLANVLRRVVTAALRAPEDLRERYPTLDRRLAAYQSLARRVTSVLLAMIGTALVLQAWSVDVAGLLASDTGQWLLSQTLTLVLIVVGVMLAWEASSVVIESVLNEHDADGNPRVHSARLRTLLPLFMNTLRAVLGVMLVLMILSQLGVDIAPLLAGAGVFGLAVGFGAQSLVKDVITGTFILLEDSITVGDVVTLGDHTGTVELMSLRTIKLRDVSGNVHTVPYGDVSTVLNMTKDFSYAALEVGVAYRENYDEVVEILKNIAGEMAADSAWSSSLIGELEIQGLDSFGASSVNIRVRIRTVPGAQWRVRREFNRRIKAAFDAAGVEIPFPHQTLYFGIDKNGNAPAARVRIESETTTSTSTAPDADAGPAQGSDERA